MRKWKTMVAATALFLGGMAMVSAAAETQVSDERAFAEMFGQGPQEEDVYRTDRLLLSATGSLKPVHLAPSVATVITAEDIEMIGATTLDEVLATVPGLHVALSGTAFFASTWSIRAINNNVNNHALLLINSVPFTSNYVGGRPLPYRMPVAMISRVEVVRGPGSALHGADAFSGTINVITKDNHEIDGTRVGVRAGSFDTYATWLQHGRVYGGWEVALGLEWQRSQGDDGRIIEEDYLHAIGAAAQSNAPGALDSSYELLESHLNVRKRGWNLHLYGVLHESNLGLGSLQVLTDKSQTDQKSLLADLTYQNDELLNNWGLTVRAYYSYIHRDTVLQLLPVSYLNMIGNPISESQDGGFEITGLYEGLDDHQVRIGAGFKDFNYEPDQYKNFGPAATDPFGEPTHVTDPNYIFMPPATRQLWYMLIQDEWQLARAWALTAGLRHDNYSDFGSTTNPRVALVWETRYDLTTKLMYGQAFRSPSFGEQWVKNNPQTIGNPDLAPEEVENLELAFDYQPIKDFRLVLSTFIYEAENLIELAGSFPQPFTNLGEQEGHGFEVEMDWLLLPSLRLRSNFAYQRSRYKKTDYVVPDAPKMQFYLNPNWEFLPDWSLDGQFCWVGGRQRAEADPRDDIADYEVVNLTLRRKNIVENWQAALAVRNVFDEDVRSPSPYDETAPEGAFVPDDYPMEGRAVWLEIKSHF